MLVIRMLYKIMFLWYFLFDFLTRVLVVFTIYFFLLDPLRFGPASRLAHMLTKVSIIPRAELPEQLLARWAHRA